jgi:predicted nucleic-acid-binding protein
MKPVLILDANIVLRFLRQDDPTQGPACADLFTRAERGGFSLKIDAVSFAEVVWVLISFYKQPRAKVAELLSSLLQHPAIMVENQDRVQKALLLFASTNTDFIDCYLAAQGLETGYPIVTYDHDFKKFSGIACRTPEKV